MDNQTQPSEQNEPAVVKFDGPTPGPWRIGPTHKDGSFAIHAEAASVVHCTPFSSSARQAKANATLIAAAPDILAALKMAADTIH